MQRRARWLQRAGLLFLGLYAFALLLRSAVTARPLYALAELTWRLRRSWDPYLSGRLDSIDPSPRCCVAEDCLSKAQSRFAVVTSLRTERYLGFFEELACSLRKSNPELQLLVLSATQDRLSESVRRRAKLLARVHQVDDIDFDLNLRSVYKEDGRYALNWIKLRAWELTDWDALLWIDSDASVVGNVSSIFQLPTDFAAALDQGRTTNRYSSLGKIQGGVFMLRPCLTMARHMMALATSHAELQFRYAHAEQDFLDWYFKYTRFALPIEWNAMAHKLTLTGLTAGGVRPRIIHYTEKARHVVQRNRTHQYCNFTQV